MLARLLTALALATAFATSPALAADEPAKKSDSAAALLDVLFEPEVQLGEGANVTDIPLLELLTKLSKSHAVTFVILEEYFKAEMYPGDIKEAKPKLAATSLRGLSLHHFLTTVLGSMDAAYLVRGGTIEIVPRSHATKLAKAGAGAAKGLTSAHVSLVVKEKPLNEAVAMLAERYDLSVVIAPQAGDARMTFVTARLLNVAADDALGVLAIQADLRVVRKGTAFLVTSRDHANELFAENMEKERQKIELDKFRAAPPPRPVPEPKNDFQIPPGLGFQSNGQHKGQHNGPYPNRMKPDLIVNGKPTPQK